MRICVNEGECPVSEKKRSAKEFFMDNNKKNLKIFIAVAAAI